MKNLFSSAASLLLGDMTEASVIHDVHLLLTELGYVRPAGVEPDHETRHRARLLRIAAQFIRIFELAAPEAPRLVAFGAEVDPAAVDALHHGSPPVSVSGIGVTMLGVMYVAFLGGFLVSTRMGFENHLNLSTHLLGYFFIVIFASDTAITRPSFWPRWLPGSTRWISPSLVWTSP